jgi:hypothetical protein
MFGFSFIDKYLSHVFIPIGFKNQTSKHIFFICERIYYENKPGAKTPK